MSSGMNAVSEGLKKCTTVQQALAYLANEIDGLAEMMNSSPQPSPFEQHLEWGQEIETPMVFVDVPAPDNRAVIDGDDVIVKPVSFEREDARHDFAASNRLSEFYGPSLSEEDFIIAYRKGGPRWLYYTNRECVMQMPYELRRALVADVLLDSPSEADEIGRDILKFEESMEQGAQVDLQRMRLGKASS